MISRRRFIQAVAAITVLIPKQFLMAKGFLSTNTFKVPTLDLGKRKGRDVYFELNLTSGFSKFIPHKKTATWGINQLFLGTTLRVQKNDRVHIRVNNRLNETTTLHWHGMKLPAKADGGPHQPIKPNGSWLSEYDIIQPAATTWYHAHQMHKTGEHVYKGLAGMMIIDDEQSKALNLPSEYGVDDFPVIIQDRDFNRNGSFSYIRSRHDRMMGKSATTILVNGVINPVLQVNKSLIRLRILNGSNARVYNLSFDDKRNFFVIGSDGGLLEKSIKTNMIIVSPAERVEILVDVSDGGMPTLINQSSGQSMGMRMRENDSNGNMAIFQINARNVQQQQAKIPATLVSHKTIDLAKLKRRYFELEMKMGPMMMFGDPFSINGKTMDIDRIDETIKAGSSEIWIIKNTSMMAHPFHIHNTQFKILDKQSGMSSHEYGFKDTVLVQPNETVQIWADFPDYKDKSTPYMYHCHILEHEDQGMMGQFVTI